LNQPGHRGKATRDRLLTKHSPNVIHYVDLTEKAKQENCVMEIILTHSSFVQKISMRGAVQRAANQELIS
jgi:hypothetical protein